MFAAVARSGHGCGPGKMVRRLPRNNRIEPHAASTSFGALVLAGVASRRGSLVVSEGDVATGVCPNCGTPRVGSFRFCRSCGLDFDATIEAPSGQESPQRDAPNSTDRHKPANAELEDTGRARLIAGTLGQDLNVARRRGRLTQAQLGRRIGLSGARIGELERGDGATASLAVWVRLGEAIGRPLVATFSQESEEPEPPDASHIAAQELVIHLARQHGRQTDVEPPARPAGHSRSIDVVLQDDVARALIRVEIWNTLTDLEAAVHSTSLNVPESAGPAMVAARDEPQYRFATCWLLVDTGANRRLVVRDPEILESSFPGSSVRWARCLVEGVPPPTELGLAWIDPRGRRIVPFRRRRRT